MNYNKDNRFFRNIFYFILIFLSIFLSSIFFGLNYRGSMTKIGPLSFREAIQNAPLYAFVSLLVILIALKIEKEYKKGKKD